MRLLRRSGGPPRHDFELMRPLSSCLLLQQKLPSEALEAEARWSQAMLRHARGAAAGGLAARLKKGATKPTPDTLKYNDATPIPAALKHGECAICLEPLGPSSPGFCALPCSHALHVPCAGGLRSFGLVQVCPMCRTELPPGPAELIEEGCRLFIPLKKLVERSGGAWGRLTAAQRRTMEM